MSVSNTSEAWIVKAGISSAAFVSGLGFEHNQVVAAMLGCACALPWVMNLTARQLLGAIAGNVLVACYFATPAAQLFHAMAPTVIELSAKSGDRAAFLLGCVGHFIVQAFVALGERFKKDPVQVIKDLKP